MATHLVPDTPRP